MRARTGTLRAAALAAVTLAPTSTGAGPGASRIVVCAPGYPGSTLEAQPTLAAFAAVLGGAAGLGRGGLSAVYHETEEPGVSELGRPEATFALVPLCFFLKHEKALGLVARAQAVPQGGAANEVWSLVAGKGRVTGAAALDGYELVSLAGYAPSFVKGAALGAWGKVPSTARVVASSSVLSGLRRAAAGEKVALLLDGAQSAALSSLPIAADLEVVARSAPLPSVVFCTVGGRAGDTKERDVVKALLELTDRPGGAAALSGLRIQEFLAVDEGALQRARSGYGRAAETP